MQTWGKKYGVVIQFFLLDMGYKIKTQHNYYPMSASFYFISAQVLAPHISVFAQVLAHHISVFA
jgi:hypothetical protein